MARFLSLLAVCFAAVLQPAAYGVVPPILRTSSVVRGESIDRTFFGPTVIEGNDAVMERERVLSWSLRIDPKARNGEPGSWVVPSTSALGHAHSGNNYLVNKWGDTAMGIGFPDVVDVQGAYIAGQAAPGAWATSLIAVGYLQGKVIATTDRFTLTGKKPVWFEMNLCGVDRIVIRAGAAVGQSGWYALDDLTFTVQSMANQGPVVLDFEDLPARSDLTGSNYAGLTWERGTGQFMDVFVHRPMSPSGYNAATVTGQQTTAQASGTNALGPQLIKDFKGVQLFDGGAGSVPPDTHGAIGPNHFVEVVNRNFAIYDKATGTELMNVRLDTSFLPGASGDPRVLYDQYSDRWIVIASDFSTKIFLAVSLTNDPTGSWVKVSFVAAQGIDAGTFPDYPTLGVDANGIYIASFMAGSLMTIFAIDKAPLVGLNPALDTVTAFRGLPFEGAIQPVHTYGTAPGEYFVSVRNASQIRIRRLDGPLTAPTLIELGFAATPTHTSPPDALSLGSTIPLDTIGDRLMNAVYRDGSLWTTHTTGFGTTSACRWYELDPETTVLLQSGVVSDPTLYFFYPSIAVNAAHDVVLAFSGSNVSQYASVYYTGRLAGDAPGDMATPTLMTAGLDAYQKLDQFGRNRWGDYSNSSLDPSDQTTIWTVQEYAGLSNSWVTRIAELLPNPCIPPDTREIGSTELAATPQPGTSAVALSVGGDPTDPDVACVSKFVQADGTLGNTPVFQLPADWAEVTISGADVVPSSQYLVFTHCPGFVSAGTPVQTGLWGDIVPDGHIDIVDVVQSIVAFSTQTQDPVLFAAADIGGCSADGSLDIVDVVQEITNFSEYHGDYSLSNCPQPCP